MLLSLYLYLIGPSARAVIAYRIMIELSCNSEILYDTLRQICRGVKNRIDKHEALQKRGSLNNTQSIVTAFPHFLPLALK